MIFGKGLNFSRDREFEERLVRKFGGMREVGYDEYVRASEVYEVCPREEVIVYLNGVVRRREVGVKTGLSFFFGEVMHDALRDRILNDFGGFVLLGKWECRVCKRLHGDENKPIRRPSVCSGCKNSDFRYVELEYRDDSLRLRGEVDGIIEDESGVRHLLEIKVVSNSFFKYLLNTFSLRYYYQIQAYFYLTGLSSCKVVLVNRDSDGEDDMVAVLEVVRDDVVIDEIVMKARLIVGGIARGMYPSGVCSSPSDKRAKSCPVADICFFNF